MVAINSAIYTVNAFARAIEKDGIEMRNSHMYLRPAAPNHMDIATLNNPSKDGMADSKIWPIFKTEEVEEEDDYEYIVDLVNDFYQIRNIRNSMISSKIPTAPIFRLNGKHVILYQESKAYMYCFPLFDSDTEEVYIAYTNTVE